VDEAGVLRGAGLIEVAVIPHSIDVLDGFIGFLNKCLLFFVFFVIIASITHYGENFLAFGHKKTALKTRRISSILSVSPFSVTRNASPYNVFVDDSCQTSKPLSCVCCHFPSNFFPFRGI
jgi:hypothetical protein